MLDKIWYESHPLGLPLRPLSALMGGLVKARQKAYELNLLTRYRAPVPVIVVGNISVGGTGKTPFIIWLAELLQGQGVAVGVVSRGYRAEAKHSPYEITGDSSVEQVGDEPFLIYQRLKCPVVIGSQRAEAIQLLLARHRVDIILSDDGMQHYAMARDLEIALIDGTRGLGNGQLLPAGPLREPPQRLQAVDYIVANTAPFDDAVLMQLQPGLLRNGGGEERLALSSLAGQAVHAVAGIGNPSRFFNLLKNHGLEVIEHPKPDHHQFSEKDLQFADDLPVIVTEKDAVKCRQFASDKLLYLPVEAQLPEAFASDLLKRIKTLIDERRAA